MAVSFIGGENRRTRGENHRPAASHWPILSHNVVDPWAGFAPTTSVVIDTDCIGSCKSNYHTIYHGHDGPNLVSENIWLDYRKIKECTDNRQKYSDASIIPYIFHINFSKAYPEVNSHPISIIFISIKTKFNFKMIFYDKHFENIQAKHTTELISLEIHVLLIVLL